MDLANLLNMNGQALLQSEGINSAEATLSVASIGDSPKNGEFPVFSNELSQVVKGEQGDKHNPGELVRNFQKDVGQENPAQAKEKSHEHKNDRPGQRPDWVSSGSPKKLAIGNTGTGKPVGQLAGASQFQHEDASKGGTTAPEVPSRAFPTGDIENRPQNTVPVTNNPGGTKLDIPDLPETHLKPQIDRQVRKSEVGVPAPAKSLDWLGRIGLQPDSQTTMTSHRQGNLQLVIDHKANLAASLEAEGTPEAKVVAETLIAPERLKESVGEVLAARPLAVDVTKIADASNIEVADKTVVVEARGPELSGEPPQSQPQVLTAPVLIPDDRAQETIQAPVEIPTKSVAGESLKVPVRRSPHAVPQEQPQAQVPQLRVTDNPRNADLVQKAEVDTREDKIVKQPVTHGSQVREFVHSRIAEKTERRQSTESGNRGIGREVREFIAENRTRITQPAPQPANAKASSPVEDTGQKTQATVEVPQRQQVTKTASAYSQKPGAEEKQILDIPVAKDIRPQRKMRQDLPRNSSRTADRQDRPEADRPQMDRPIRSLRERRAPASREARTQTTHFAPDTAQDREVRFGHTVREMAASNFEKQGFGQVISKLAAEKSSKPEGSEARERTESASNPTERIGQAEAKQTNLQRAAAPLRIASSQEAYLKVVSAVERMNAVADTNRMQLRLQFDNGDQLRVVLKYAKGAVQTTFVTDSEGLRIAMRDGWDQFQRQMLEKGVDAGTPEFQHGRHEGNEREAEWEHGDEIAMQPFSDGSQVKEAKPTAVVGGQPVPESSSQLLNTYA